MHASSSLSAADTSTTFGAAPRFSESLDDEMVGRPHAYRGFTPLLDRANGRAVSAIGTFSTGPRRKIAGTCATEVAFYVSDVGGLASAKHSRGVKRTEPRFRYLVNDESPGPIYKPFEHNAAGAPKFTKAPRFPTPHLSNAHQRRTGSSPSPTRTERAGSASKTHCTFGVRHDHLDERPVGAQSVRPHCGQTDPDAWIPKYSGKIGTSTRTQVKDEGYPGPGHFLKSEFKSEAPRWSFGRRRAPERSCTPGPGAYRIDKYKPVNKPKGESFPRVGHTVLRGLPGLDSPGPALYSVMGK